MKALIIFCLSIFIISANGQPLSNPVTLDSLSRQQGRIVFPPRDTVHVVNQMPTLFIKPYSLPDSGVGFIAPNQTFTTVIINNSFHSVSLYPYLNRRGIEQISWGDSFLLASLQTQAIGMTDTDAIRLKMVQFMGSKLQKTDIYLNNLVQYNAADANLISKQNSLMGALNGTYHKQCGNSVKNAIAILVKTGYFNYSDFRMVQLIGHITCDFKYKGAWTFADFDMDEPFFMVIDTLNANGFASSEDIYINHNLITSSQRYKFVNDLGDSIDLCPNVTMQAYQARFDSLTIFPVDNLEPLNISGGIVLPSQARVISGYQSPYYILDSFSLSKILSVYLQDPDSAISMLAARVNISVDSASTVITKRKLTTKYTTQNWVPNYTGIVPVLKIVLPATLDTVKVQNGVGNNVSFAGYITATNAEIHLQDTLFQAGESPNLWIQSVNGISANVSDGSIQYLTNGGFIVPHSTNNDTISVSFNPEVINYGTGFLLGYMAGDSIQSQSYFGDSLITADSTYITFPHLCINPREIEPYNYLLTQNDSIVRNYRALFNENDTASGIVDLPNKLEVKVYPNPTSDKLHITTNGIANAIELMLYDMDGKLVLQYAGSDKSVVDISALDSGVYVCLIENNVHDVVYNEKIIIMHRKN